MGAGLRHIFSAVILFTLGFFVISAGLIWLDSHRTQVLVIGAGHKQGESYAMVSAISRLATKYDPKLRIIVAETGGSGQNTHMLSEGLLQMATIQADTPTGPRVRLVTSLYPDVFQLLVRKDRAINSVAELKGKSVALPSRSSGQYRSFLFLARYYGLSPRDMNLISMSSRAASWAIVHGGVDALFRVRAPGNAELKEIIHSDAVKILPIPHTRALRLVQPAIEEGVLPAGSYRGAPAVPERDLPVPMVRRLLVAGVDVPPDLVERVTRLIYEHRRELASLTPLSGFIAAPDTLFNHPIPLHEGARRYYERDKPSFLQENAELLALYLTILAGAASILLRLNTRRQKARVDAYNRELIALYNQAVTDPNPREEYYRDRMMEIFARVLKDSEDGNINTTGFEFLSFAWDELNDAIIEITRERKYRAARHERVPSSPGDEPAHA